MQCRLATPFLAALAIAAATAPASSRTLRLASQGDALSMDPHSLSEAVQLSVTGNVYEPLVERDRDFKLAPSLATSWVQLSPTVWRFELRRNVQFHDRTPFTADDVVFSWERARSEGSDVLNYVAPIKEVVKVDPHRIEIVTHDPYPILPELLTTWYIMSKSWCLANQAAKSVDRRKGVENAASFRANGTGPFMVRERVPGVRTVFRRNPVYWRDTGSNVDEVQFDVVGNDATRLAALLSGEADLIDPLPIHDAERVAAQPALKVIQAPETRIIFLGMDQRRSELQFSSVKGKNPFKDRRVRQAFYQAIDADAIRGVVMRGAARPAALMVTPEVNGFPQGLNRRLPFDPEASRRLLAEAGYPNGFEIRLNCPNDRYANDARICQAVAAHLARVGVKVELEVESKATWFPRILKRETSFYLLGWSPVTGDAHNVLFSVLSSPGEAGRGGANIGGYSNPRIDELTARVATLTDRRARDELIHEAMRLHQEDVGHIPLHQQFIFLGARRDLSVVQHPNSRMPWRYARFTTPEGGK